MSLATAIIEKPARPPVHVRDSDCTLDADGECIGCGVSHVNAPCLDCGGRGLHLGDVEGPERCGWKGEKQALAKRLCGECRTDVATMRASKGGGVGSDVCRRCWKLEYGDTSERGE